MRQLRFTGERKRIIMGLDIVERPYRAVYEYGGDHKKRAYPGYAEKR